MKKTFILQILTLLFLLGIYTYSYQKFSAFKPEITPEERPQTIGNSKNKERIKLPFPEKYNLISNNQTDSEDYITFETIQSPDSMQMFYRNILISKNWAIESTGKENIFTTTKYKSGDSIIEVTTSLKQASEQTSEFNTIVGLVIRN